MMLGDQASIEVDEARAVLGVESGTAPRVLRRRYLALVRHWHPDRFASNPHAQAVATERLRQIIAAYEILSSAQFDDASADPRGSSTPQADAISASWSRVAAGERLSRTRIDEIIASIASPTPLEAFFTFVARSWPLWLAWGISVTPYGSGPPKGTRLAIILALAALGGWLWWRRRAPFTSRSGPALPDWNRIASGLIAMVWIGLHALALGGGGVMMAAIAIALPLVCIWYPEEIGAAGLPQLTAPSPGWMVRLFGWIAFGALLAKTLVFFAVS